MMHMEVSMNCMFNGNFKLELAVLPPGSNVAAIPDGARDKAMQFWDRIAARINLIRNVLQSRPTASKKICQPRYLQFALFDRKCISAQGLS